MGKVSGIGAVFFRADNPVELAAWYEGHLGVSPVPTSNDQLTWVQEQGPQFLRHSNEVVNISARKRKVGWSISVFVTCAK